MADDPPKTDQIPLGMLLQGAEKTFDNAERLFREAELLAAAGAMARALCLHQISLEECSKVDTLGAWAVSQLLGSEVDQKKMLAALARHASKNKANAYMLEVSDAEEAARARGDWAAASVIFKQTQAAFHDGSNRAKNASLYVDWVDGAFVAPSERVNPEMLAEIVERNATFLGYAFNNLKTLRRLDASPDDVRDLLSGLMEKAEQLRAAKPDNLMEAWDRLMSDFSSKVRRSLARILPMRAIPVILLRRRSAPILKADPVFG